MLLLAVESALRTYQHEKQRRSSERHGHHRASALPEVVPKQLKRPFLSRTLHTRHSANHRWISSQQMPRSRRARDLSVAFIPIRRKSRGKREISCKDAHITLLPRARAAARTPPPPYNPGYKGSALAIHLPRIELRACLLQVGSSRRCRPYWWRTMLRYPSTSSPRHNLKVVAADPCACLSVSGWVGGGW